jgi:multisubunit Na+/H+ antiporter MnhF subunit
MISLAIPSTLTFHIGDTKFYAARLIVVLALIPAVAKLFASGRRLLACDLLTTAASFWMVAAIIIAGQTVYLSSSLALLLEFWGGYLFARGFVYGPPAVDAFLRYLKLLLAVAVAAGLLDHLSGRLVLNAIIGPLVGEPLGWEPEYRSGLLRAMSIFPHPILYGAFCAASGAIFLYARQRAWVALSFLGCVTAMSSAPMLAFFIVFAVYTYDSVLGRQAWRWKGFVAGIAAGFAVIYVVTEHPVSWVVAHLTLDPSTGYFRQATWDRAFYNIGLSPLTGYGFGDIVHDDPANQDFFDNASVDAVWLVLALRFGLPIVPLLLLACISCYFGDGPARSSPRSPSLRTGFTLAVWVLMITGLTVHYWNMMWLFWGVCLGVRASMKEGLALSLREKIAAASRLRASSAPRPSVRAARPARLAASASRPVEDGAFGS